MKVLVLSRKNSESLVLGHSVLITVIEIHPDWVSLGFSVPNGVSVHRSEEDQEIAFDDPGVKAQLAAIIDPSGKPKPSASPLVLSLRKDEKLVIAGVIVVMVIEIRGDKVRLGVETPRDVNLHRLEVYAAIRRETESEAQPGEN
jgi:carbon storage regulator